MFLYKMYIRQWGNNMRYEKKFINFGASRAVIIPDQWIIMAEKKFAKKMFGVVLEVNNEEIEVTPMWESEAVEN